MVVHPQQIEDRKITERENLLWWELDKIAVKGGNPFPKNTWVERSKKADAAENMMRHLQRPTPEWCRERYHKEQTS